MRLFAAILFTLTTAAYAADYSEGGYTSRTSVIAGGTISFHIATAASPFDVQIVNLAQPDTVLATIGGLTSAPHDCTGLWETGCAWPVTTQFTVPATWPSGYYAARFPTSSGRPGNAIFVVRSANPGVSATIVVISPTHTYAAYNNFGGKSLDDAQSTNNQRAHIVSFNRPYTDNNGLGRFPMWEQQFVDWMKSENRPFDVITDEDAEDIALLNNYNKIFIIGQSEYWTWPARQSLETYHTSGSRHFDVGARGSITILGASTMIWQARTNPQTRQLICYKDRALDPEDGVHNNLVTVRWADEPVSRPENALIGGSFRTAGHANEIAGTEEGLPDAERTGYRVWNAKHWILEGTGLALGDTFGAVAAGTRVDGATFTLLGGPSGALQPYSDGSDGSPYNLEIVATIPAEKGYGLIGAYNTPLFGSVINVGTRDWTHGLRNDSVVQQITRNLVTNYASFYGPAWSYPRALKDGFEMPSARPGIVPGWSGNPGGASLGAACAAGSSGLKLDGAEPVRLSRNFTPTNEPLADAEVSVYLNLDGLQSTGPSPLRLVTFESAARSRQPVRRL